MADEISALRVRVSQQEDFHTQLETRIADDVLLIQRLQDEVSSLRIQISDWKGMAAKLEAKVALHVAKISDLNAVGEELQKKLSERILDQVLKYIHTYKEYAYDFKISFNIILNYCSGDVLSTFLTWLVRPSMWQRTGAWQKEALLFRVRFL